MLGLATVMNTGWQMLQSTLSAIGGVLFAKSPQSKSTRQPIGLDQLIQTKGYWVDKQLEVFAELHEAEHLTAKRLQSALNELLGQLGTHLGSPAVMLIELERLHAKLTGSDLLDFLLDAKATIQASMIKEPKVAYANLMADIQLLCEDTSMQFINSAEGRAWLDAYRPFFSVAAFEQAMAKIKNFANGHLGELYSHLKARGESPAQIADKLSEAQSEINNFCDWVDRLKGTQRRPIQPRVREVLQNWDQAKEREEETAELKSTKRTSGFGTRVVSILLQTLKLPISLMTRYPKLAGSLILATRAGVTIAQAAQGQRVYLQTQDVSDSFQSRRLNADEFGHARHGLSAQDITDAYGNRHVQKEPEDCFTGIRQEGWMLTLGGITYDSGSDVAIGPEGKIVLVGETRSDAAENYNVLVAQFSAEGQLAWAQALSGSFADSGRSIAIGSQGQIVIAGDRGSYGVSGSNILLAQISAEGELAWSLQLGESTYAKANGIAIGPQDQVVLVGDTAGYGPGGSNVLLIQVSAVGELAWAQVLPLNYDHGSGITIGPQGQIVLVGSTSSYDTGGNDVLLAQVSPAGELMWAQSLGGPYDDRGYGVTIGLQSQIVLVGNTWSYTAEDRNVLLSQFNARGELEWVQALGESGTGEGYGITIGPQGQIVLVGTMTSNSLGKSDVLLAQLGAGGELAWARTLGGHSFDTGSGVAVGEGGQIVLVGTTSSFGPGECNVLLAQLSAEGQLWGLSSEVNLQPASRMVQSDKKSVFTNQPISVEFQNLAENFTATRLTESRLEHIPNIVATMFSVRANQNMAQQLADPVVNQEYVLPLSGLLVPTSAVLGVDLSKAIWLDYDAHNQQLIGTPMLTRPGQAKVSVTVQLAKSKGSASVTIALCVKPGTAQDYMQLLFWPPNNSGNEAATGPQDALPATHHAQEYLPSPQAGVSQSKVITNDSSQQRIIHTVGAACLVGMILAGLALRERRIHQANKMVIIWAKSRKAASQQKITPIHLEQQLGILQHHIRTGSDVSTLEGLFVAFKTTARGYYSQDSTRKDVFTNLVSACGLLEDCLLSIRSMILEGDTTQESAAAQAYGISNFLHGLFRLLLELHTGRGLIIAKNFKVGLSQSIRYISSRMDKKSLLKMCIYHNLISCQEIMICMLDSENLPRQLLSALMHVVSPMNLLNDLKSIVVDFPSLWYVKLLEVSSQADLASRDATALKRIQETALQRSDWRFRYGLIPVYLSILSKMQNETLQTTLINGRVLEGKIKQLGYIHLLTQRHRLCRRHDKRIRVSAGHLLNERIDILPAVARNLLHRYLYPKSQLSGAGSKQRNTVQASSTPVSSQYVHDGPGMMGSSGCKVSTTHNPLETDLVADPQCAVAISSRRARQVQDTLKP